MSNSPKNLQKTQKLASKNPWIAGILTFFIPLAGYLYTRRLKAFLVSLLIVGGFGALALSEEEVGSQDYEDIQIGIVFLYMIGTCIDNTLAVNRAKTNMKLFNLSPNNWDTSPPDLKIRLLRFIKREKEVTLADCVAELAVSTSTIRELLEELLKEELVSVNNRQTDGIVVYRFN